MKKIYGKNYVDAYVRREGEGRLERLIDLINFDKNDVCLDYGCGNGFLYPLIKNKVKKYIGVDTSSDFIKVAKGDKKNIGAEFILIKEGQNLKKINKQKFDKIFLFDLTEHLKDRELVNILKNCKEVLESDGSIYIHTPNLDYFMEAWKRVGFVKQIEGHIGVRNEKQYRRILQKAKLDNSYFKYLGHYDKYLGKLNFLAKLPMVGKFFQARLFIEIKKENIEKNKSIIFIARNYPPTIGGMERMNYELGKYLQKHYQVKIIANKRHRFSIRFLIEALFQTIKSQEKIVILSDALLGMYIPILKLFNKKIIIKVHGLDVLNPNRLYRNIILSGIKKADYAIAISKAVKDACADLNINPKKFKVIPVGIDLDRFEINTKKIDKEKYLLSNFGIKLNSRKILLTVGRLVERKGVPWFVPQIMPELKNSYIYLIVGKGEKENEIKNFIRQNRLEKQVFLLGQIKDSLLEKIYQCVDLFIFPNIKVNHNMEGFGIAALEAACHGVTIVASNIDGITEALDKQNAYLVESKNKKAYLKSINDYFQLSNKKQQEIKESSKKYSMSKFDWNKIILEYKKLIDEL